MAKLLECCYCDFWEDQRFWAASGPIRPDAPKHSLAGTYGRILDFSFGGRTENAHETDVKSSSVLIFVDLCSVFQAGAVLKGLGPNCGRKEAEIRPKPTYR